MDIIEAFATKNKCYQAATPLRPRGILCIRQGRTTFITRESMQSIISISTNARRTPARALYRYPTGARRTFTALLATV